MRAGVYGPLDFSKIRSCCGRESCRKRTLWEKGISYSCKVCSGLFCGVCFFIVVIVDGIGLVSWSCGRDVDLVFFDDLIGYFASIGGADG